MATLNAPNPVEDAEKRSEYSQSSTAATDLAHPEKPVEESTPAAPSTEKGLGNGNDDTLADEKAAPAPDDAFLNQTYGQRPAEAWKWYAAMAAMLCTAFLYGLDTTIAADVQPAIYKSLGDIGKLAWIGIGFPLGSAGTILPIGYAYGQFNIKWIYIGCFILFEAGSALCGGAPNMNALIWGRVIAGIGGGGMYLGVLNYVAIFTSLRERPIYSATIGLVWGIGTILGPVIGGAFASNSNATWRWAFYINLCIAVPVAPIFLFVVFPFRPRADTPFKTKILEMDWIGIVLTAAIFTTFILSFSLVGSEWGWSDGRFIAMIVVFAVVLIAFCVQQAFQIGTTKERQIFPIQFLKRRSMVLMYIVTAATAGAYFNFIYYIPLYFQFDRSDTAIMAAVRLLPFICVAVTFMMISGGLAPVVGYYSPWYMFGGIFILVSGACMFTVDANTSISRVYGFSVMGAMGTGTIVQLAYSIAAAKVPLHQIPAAISWINIAQIGSISLALTVSGQIFQSYAFRYLSSALAGHNYSAAEIRDAIAGTQSAIFQSGSAAVQKAALEAIVKAMDRVYICVIVSGGAIIIASVFMRHEKLSFSPVASSG